MILAGVALAAWRTPQQPAVQPLKGTLDVLVRPADRTVEPVSVATPGAAPTQAGGAMCLDVELNQPAYTYLVWIDSGGQVWPLYPWNNERLEVTDIGQPPPERRPGALVFSPLLGHSWTLGSRGGVETVLLLARRTPWPADVDVAAYLRDWPAAPLAEGRTHATLTVDAATRIVNDAGSGAASGAAAGAVEPSLRDALLRLGEHFEVVQAVRFAHAAP